MTRLPAPSTPHRRSGWGFWCAQTAATALVITAVFALAGVLFLLGVWAWAESLSLLASLG